MADSRDKPEIETLSYKPPKCALPDENGGVLATPIMSKEEAEKTAREYFKTTEQPNHLMIIEEIEGLMTCVSNSIYKLDRQILTTANYQQPHKLIGQALEEIDIFQKTTLFELKKTFE